MRREIALDQFVAGANIHVGEEKNLILGSRLFGDLSEGVCKLSSGDGR